MMCAAAAAAAATAGGAATPAAAAPPAWAARLWRMVFAKWTQLGGQAMWPPRMKTVGAALTFSLATQLGRVRCAVGGAQAQVVRAAPRREGRREAHVNAAGDPSATSLDWCARGGRHMQMLLVIPVLPPWVGVQEVKPPPCPWPGPAVHWILGGDIRGDVLRLRAGRVVGACLVPSAHPSAAVPAAACCATRTRSGPAGGIRRTAQEGRESVLTVRAASAPQAEAEVEKKRKREYAQVATATQRPLECGKEPCSVTVGNGACVGQPLEPTGIREAPASGGGGRRLGEGGEGGGIHRGGGRSSRCGGPCS